MHFFLSCSSQNNTSEYKTYSKHSSCLLILSHRFCRLIFSDIISFALFGFIIKSNNFQFVYWSSITASISFHLLIFSFESSVDVINIALFALDVSNESNIVTLIYFGKDKVLNCEFKIFILSIVKILDSEIST